MDLKDKYNIKKKFAAAKRVVVKVGTSSLVYANGKLNFRAFDLLARQLADLKNSGRQVVLVSSGAVAAGMGKLALAEKPSEISKKQALAAIGQGFLMQVYEKFFGEYGINVAQVLLTKEDISHRDRYLNAGNTFNALFDYDILPIVNENDTTSLNELKVGDNDTLAALTSCLVEADLLILLSDIDGLYTANPRHDKNAERIDVVEEITAEIEAMAGSAGSCLGTGGMMTKIHAAKIANSCGIPMVLADGSFPEIVFKVMKGEDCGTVFMPKNKAMVGKKGWLAYGAVSRGKIIIDDGALVALVKKGGSLLPSGIKGVEGSFSAGDIVAVYGENNPAVEIAKGFVNYNSSDIEKIKGCQCCEIAGILEAADYADEVIHRDYMSVKI
ncbi:MAG: glutamate 5-kinase [Bacillota bacterium]|jgi:glutamate 5-kinase